MLPQLGVSGLQPSGAGGCLRNAPRAWELPSRRRCFHHFLHCVDTVSFPVVPDPQLSPLLCIFFTAQLAVRH
uniref:Uncharacterized protein n=1 Tax=Canis lupus dingo TaxID=286419 RepID=A0A8C0JPJ7_CANLU